MVWYFWWLGLAGRCDGRWVTVWPQGMVWTPSPAPGGSSASILGLVIYLKYYKMYFVFNKINYLLRYCYTDILHCYPITLLQSWVFNNYGMTLLHSYNTTTLLHCYTTLPLCFTATLLYHSASLLHYSTTLLHCYTTLPLCFTATLLYHFASLLHYSTTSQSKLLHKV